MSFAEEVQASQRAAPAKPAAAEPTAPVEGFDTVAPTPELPVPPAQASTPEPVVAAPKETSIKIGTQEFKTVEAALAYAQDLELAVIQTDAFNRGKDAATPKAPEAPKETVYTKWEKEVFEKPAETLRELAEHVRKETIAEIKTQAQQETDKKIIWEQFYKDNADLAKHTGIVDHVLQTSMNEVGPMPLPKALETIAKRARGVISSVREEALASQTLSSTPVIVPGATGGSTSQAEAQPKTALDFVSQLNKHRKRSAAQE